MSIAYFDLSQIMCKESFDLVPVKYKKCFSIRVIIVDGAGQNSNPGESESELGPVMRRMT